MYIIKKNGKRTSRKYFVDYEFARSYVRKLIRKSYPYWGHHNPPISIYGYTIVLDKSCPF